jgi:hypothetical protein
MIAILLLALQITTHCATCPRNSRGRIARSSTAIHQFERQHPCPATHRRTGPCPGYVVDHIYPLACGGKDAPSNMQWQSVADAKAKDKWERNCRLSKLRARGRH